MDGEFFRRLRPAPLDGGFAMPDYWVWCGSVILGEDNRYHMFAARWPRAYPFYEGYGVASEVVRAVADRPEGPYRFQEVVLPARGSQYWDGRMTHNPTIIRRGNRYLLFYIGTTYPGPTPTPGQLRAPRQGSTPPPANPQAIGLAESSSVFGPWERRDRPILAARSGAWDHSMATNPAPCLLEDGRVFMLYRTYNAQVGAAVAGPDAEFTRLGSGPVAPFNGFYGQAPIEDMFIWRAAARFEMVAKDLTPEGLLCGEKHGGLHAVSADGLNWQVSDPPKAYSRRVRWSDGAQTVQGCLERPFLLIEHGRPTHLFAATGDGPGGFCHCTRTWNMCIPLA